MKILKHILNILFSLRTALWLMGLSLALFIAGAFIMPGYKEFQELHSIPLFDWLQKQSANITWWLWALIGVLSALSVNTLFCSIESIVKKRKVTQWLLLISPQIIHIGFLFILLAHLLSAVGASQQIAAVREGSLLKITRDKILKVQDIDVKLDYYGYVADWKVKVEYFSDGKTVGKDTIMPNKSSDSMGVNIIVKNIRSHPNAAALLQLNKEPGAVWALTGGILFMVGITTLIILRIRMER
jgi:hypothetical protein